MESHNDFRDAGTIVLELDDPLTIRAVDHEWELRADSFGADTCLGASIIGTPLLRHIAGGTTRQFYEQLFAWVAKHGRPIRLPYRCDAPDRRRQMELQITRLPDGFQCVHTTLSVTPTYGSHTRYAFGGDESIALTPWCSSCMRLLWQGQWRDVEAAVHAGLRVGSLAFPVYCTICPECSQQVNRLLDAAPDVPVT